MTINVSHNEIITLCTKAFDGFQHHCGESDLIANMVADLEMVGLHGTKHFANALAFLKNEKNISAKIDLLSEPQIIVNLHGNSIFCHLPLLLDYALEKLLIVDQIMLTIEQCHNRWLAFSELTRLANKGLSVKATWSNGHYPKHIIFLINSGKTLPDLYMSKNSQNNLHSITIEISKTPFSQPNQYNQHITAESLNNTKQQTYKQGILVNEKDWSMIKQAAQAILVTSNETSRLGAGEARS